MAFSGNRRLLVLIATCVILRFEAVQCYIVPDVRIELLTPKGIQVSIPAEAGTQFFAFHANVNKGISSNEHGDINGETYRAKNGRWTFTDTDVDLEDGDVLHYWIYVQATDSAYTRESQTWTVHKTRTRATEGSTNRTPTSSSTHSTPSSDSTTGRIIFEEHFHSLNKSRWTREMKMPLEPDYEFCVYHNENHQFLVQVDDGILRIQPLILEDYYGENATVYGRLQLSECTSHIQAECSRRALSFNILPPIISGRFNTKNSFSFKYGKIEIRAKFPEGDWIYPEMWLEPKYPNYGTGYANGRILLGLSRGNEHLMNMTNRSIYDSRKLDFGLRVAVPRIKQHIVSKMRDTGTRWTQDFHLYTTIWTADGFEFLVDGEEVGRLTPENNSWLEDNAYSGSKKSAPFDQEFYITIGVGVGGIRVFPDGTTSSGLPKPWKNNEAKAMLKFWHARNEWLPSWRQEANRTALQIDYIRVWSL